MTKEQFINYILTYDFPTISISEFNRIFREIDETHPSFPKIPGIIHTERMDLLPLKVEDNFVLIEVNEPVLIAKDRIRELFDDKVAEKFEDLPYWSYADKNITLEQLTDFENLIVEIFKNYHYNGDKWIVQKKRKESVKTFHQKTIGPFDYYFKILRERDIEKFELFDYYTISLEKNGDINIDCDNENVGARLNSYYFTLTTNIAAITGYRKEHLTKDSLQRFVEYIMSNYKPSIFSHT